MAGLGRRPAGVCRRPAGVRRRTELHDQLKLTRNTVLVLLM
jgi:hypothetical protein